MWIDTRDYVPIKDGTYLVQTVFGELLGLDYTLQGGWNTKYDKHGLLMMNSAIAYTYVARWYEAEKPDEVPEEWQAEYLEDYRKGVSK